MNAKKEDQTPPVKDNLGDSDRQAGQDQRAGNESRDTGNDPQQAGQESVTLEQSLRGKVEKEDKEQQAEGAKSADELGIEIRYPSDGVE